MCHISEGRRNEKAILPLSELVVEGALLSLFWFVEKITRKTGRMEAEEAEGTPPLPPPGLIIPLEEEWAMRSISGDNTPAAADAGCCCPPPTCCCCCCCAPPTEAGRAAIALADCCCCFVDEPAAAACCCCCCCCVVVVITGATDCEGGTPVGAITACGCCVWLPTCICVLLCFC